MAILGVTIHRAGTLWEPYYPIGYTMTGREKAASRNFSILERMMGESRMGWGAGGRREV
jgi:hypothetical protein